MRDQLRRRGQDVARRAIVALEPNNFRAGKVLFEAENVVDLRSTPAVNRLIIVADAADVLRTLREQPQPQILCDVRVLVLVDQHVAEALLIARKHFRVAPEDPKILEQQIAEIGGVERLEPMLIRGVERLASPVGETHGLTRRDIRRREPPVLPIVDHGSKQSRGPALLVDVRRLDHLLHEADLVVGIEDREIRLQFHELRVTA